MESQEAAVRKRVVPPQRHWPEIMPSETYKPDFSEASLQTRRTPKHKAVGAVRNVVFVIIRYEGQ